MGFTDREFIKEFINLKSDVAELRERIGRIERFIADKVLTRIGVLEQLERERDEDQRRREVEAVSDDDKPLTGG